MSNASKFSTSGARSQSQKPVRRAYQPPKLECYGSISKLTRTGNGPGTDGGIVANMHMVCL